MTTINAVNAGLSGTSGSGSFAGTTNPVFTTPNIGTPSAGTLTNCTGLPVSTGITGFGTGVATALGVNANATGGLPTITLGTFTPTLTGSGANPTSVTYSTQVGKYAIIGNIVHYYARVTVSALTIGSASGNLQITGLPVASVNTSSLNPLGSCTLLQVATTGYNFVNSWVSPNSSVINLVETVSNSATGGNSLIAITAITSTADITVTGFYFSS